jgi:hypothetical protein
MTEATPPSTEDFIAASALAYGEAGSLTSLQGLLNQAAPFDLDLSTWHPFLISSPIYDPDGMYADAFLTDAGQLVIAFEGTNNVETQLLNADVSIFDQQIPNAFLDADAFVTAVQDAAARMGFGGDPIFLTGHSLGASEAEYVAAQSNTYAGATFAGTGVPGYVNTGTSPLVDYVDYGDPIANYASDTQSSEPDFAPTTNMDHVGTVVLTGDEADSYALATATELMHLGVEIDSSTVYASGLAGLAALVSNHLLGNYAQDFNPPLSVPPGATPQDPSYIIENLPALLAETKEAASPPGDVHNQDLSNGRPAAGATSSGDRHGVTTGPTTGQHSDIASGNILISRVREAVLQGSQGRGWFFHEATDRHGIINEKAGGSVLADDAIDHRDLSFNVPDYAGGLYFKSSGTDLALHDADVGARLPSIDPSALDRLAPKIAAFLHNGAGI